MRFRTVYPKVWGGLGNQMFIYAAARAHALRTGARLLLNIGALLDDREYHRTYSLDIFDMEPEIAPVHSARVRALLDWKKELLPRFLGAYRKESEEQGVNRLPRHWWGNLWLTGYWQSEGYFSDFAEVVRRDFTLKDAGAIRASEMGRKIAACENSVFLHVRSFHEAVGAADDSRVLPLEYYENAIRYLQQHVSGDLTFFLFSDEVDFALKWLQPVLDRMNVRVLPVRAASIAAPGADLELMRMCRHAITGNSSFSWWGAWLCEHDHGAIGQKSLVLCAEGVPFPGANRDFYPERWIKISRRRIGHSAYDMVIPVGIEASLQCRHRGLLSADWNLDEFTIGSDDQLESLAGRFERLSALLRGKRSVLVTAALTGAVSNGAIQRFSESVRSRCPVALLDFHFLRFAAEPASNTHASPVDVEDLTRKISSYDREKTSVEWSFLDDMCCQNRSFSGLNRLRYKIYHSMQKRMSVYGIGSVETL